MPLRGFGRYTSHRFGDATAYTDLEFFGGGTLTLTETMRCRNLSIFDYVIDANGHNIDCLEDIVMYGTIAATSTIKCNGLSGATGAGGGAGGAGGPAGSLGGGSAGADGDVNSAPDGSGNIDSSISNSNGGDGGVGTYTGGAGGVASFDTAGCGSVLSPTVMDIGHAFQAGVPLPITGGAGGGGGGGDGTHKGGGGGGGGGLVRIRCRNLILKGYSRIHAIGGSGGIPQPGGTAGGGGGGSGGAIIIHADRVLFPDANANAELRPEGGLGAGPVGHQGDPGTNGSVYVISERGSFIFSGIVTGDQYPNGVPETE